MTFKEIRSKFASCLSWQVLMGLGAGLLIVGVLLGPGTAFWTSYGAWAVFGFWHGAEVVSWALFGTAALAWVCTKVLIAYSAPGRLAAFMVFTAIAWVDYGNWIQYGAYNGDGSWVGYGLGSWAMYAAFIGGALVGIGFAIKQCEPLMTAKEIRSIGTIFVICLFWQIHFSWCGNWAAADWTSRATILFSVITTVILLHRTYARRQQLFPSLRTNVLGLLALPLIALTSTHEISDRCCGISSNPEWPIQGYFQIAARTGIYIGTQPLSIATGVGNERIRWYELLGRTQSSP